MLRYVIPLLLLLTVVACSDDPLETPFAASVQQDSSAMTPFAAGSAQDTLSIVLNMPKAAGLRHIPVDEPRMCEPLQHT